MISLDDCDIPEVQALYEHNSDVRFLDAAPAALAALYGRVKELEAEVEQLKVGNVTCGKCKWEQKMRGM